MKLKDKSHPCPSGVFWKHVGTGTMFYWTETKSWEAFYSQIVQFCESNSFPVPSDDDLQDIICTQLGAGWCTGEPRQQQPQSEGRTDCLTCGGR